MTTKTEIEFDKAERATNRMKAAVVLMWALVVTGLIAAMFAMQHGQSSRANQRLDRLEQDYLPGKAAQRDAEYSQLRFFDCAVIAAVPKDSKLRTLAHNVGLVCNGHVVAAGTPLTAKEKAAQRKQGEPGKASAASPNGSTSKPRTATSAVVPPRAAPAPAPSPSPRPPSTPSKPSKPTPAKPTPTQQPLLSLLPNCPVRLLGTCVLASH